MAQVTPNFIPQIQIQVNNRDMTGFFEPYLLNCTFSDHLEGEADGVEITLEDAAGRFMADWYPVKGATVELWIGYEGAALLDSLACLIDEIEVKGPPSTVTIRALGAANQKATRTKKSQAFSQINLQGIAQHVATAYNLTLVGFVPDITWTRLVQHRETDLAFLFRLGKENGLVFSIKGDKLIFYDVQVLEGKPPILTVTPTDLIEWHFREKVSAGGVTAEYFDPATKQVRGVNLLLTDPNPSPNRHKIHRRTESAAHTQRLAKAALHDVKAWQRDGTLIMPGNPRLVAGGNLQLSGFGVLDGMWQIRQARHQFQRDSGYKTELEVRHIST